MMYDESDKTYMVNKELIDDMDPSMTILEHYFEYNRDSPCAILLKIVDRRFHEMSPEDRQAFDELSETLEIFRGCNISEFNTKQYGQSWSGSWEVAARFGFTGMNLDSNEHLLAEQVILKAKINKRNVFAYVNFHPEARFSGEEEFIVDPTKLESVEIDETAEEYKYLNEEYLKKIGLVNQTKDS